MGFRLARVLVLFGDLRTMVVTCLASLKYLVWVVVLMFFITYTFGVYLTGVVTEHVINAGGELPEEQEKLLEYFGTIPSSMLALFETMSEGVHWGELLEPLASYCSR